MDILEDAIVSLLPLDEDQDLENHPSIVLAQDECTHFPATNDVSLVHDDILDQDVVEITGPESQLIFPCNTILRYCVLHVKNVEQFFTCEIEIIDDTQHYRVFKVTNACSVARITPSTCQLPLRFDSIDDSIDVNDDVPELNHHQPSNNNKRSSSSSSSSSWQHACLDLETLVAKAYGTQYLATLQVRIFASCRLHRVFFQDRRYSDAELPTYLKV